MARIEDEILVLRFQAGDEAAFEGLFERHNGPITYYLRRMLDSHDLAADAAQVTWMKALRGIRHLRRLGAFRSWLFAIARNEALKQLRAVRRELPLEEEAVDVAAEEGPEFTAEDGQRLHRAMDDIDAIHREVLVLRYLEEMTYEEIASVVGCNVGTVRSRLHNAKRAVRKILEETSHA